MKNRYLGAISVLLLGFLGNAGGCSSAETVCELICDCSHCNDLEMDLVCFQYKVQEATAEAYDCSEQWEAQMTCIQEKGTCKEEESRFETRGSSSCSDTEDIGVMCMSQADCDAIGFPGPLTCTVNRCLAKVCSGNGANCSSDADCTGSGPELCDDEEVAVRKCVEAASGGDVPGPF